MDVKILLACTMIHFLHLHLASSSCQQGNCMEFAADHIYENYTLRGFTLTNITADPSSKVVCLTHCALDCACVSFNEKLDGTECQLNFVSNSTDTAPLVPTPGYKFVDIKLNSMDTQCPAAPCENDCCLFSPCRNAGKCTELCHHGQHRFNCSCAEGYTGRICQTFLGYHGLGCYKEDTSDRALRTSYLSLRKNGGINWQNIHITIRKCRDEAKARNLPYFGIFWYGVCYTDTEAITRYAMHGPSDKCWNGVGDDYSFYMYKVADEIR